LLSFFPHNFDEAISIVTTAIILGSNGQDGAYLSEVILERGYSVVGVARQHKPRWVTHPAFRHVELDVGDHVALDTLLAEIMPTEIYALAAVHGSSGFAYEPVWNRALTVNVGAVHTCLEHLRRRALQDRLFVASSLKAFGNPSPAVIDEETPRLSTCLYSITKNAATDLVAYYRLRHGVSAVVGYLFNHDSPRRKQDFFLPTLVAQLAAHLKGQAPPEAVATLEFWCDWGSSREFMEAIADIMQNSDPQDVVIASGVPVYAMDLVEALATAASSPTERWLKVASRPPHAPPPVPYRARLHRLRGLIGRTLPSDGLDVALWILRERHSISLARPQGGYSRK
jgi:GDPmannose 4,6-dehydratase